MEAPTGNPSGRIPKQTKYCFVPQCTSNSHVFPDKIFLSVPSANCMRMRQKWMSAARRPFNLKSFYRCCEDHFDLEKDVENWTRFKLMGGNIYLKKGVVPHKFECQEGKWPAQPRSLLTIHRDQDDLQCIEITPLTEEVSSESEPETDKECLLSKNTMPQVPEQKNDGTKSDSDASHSETDDGVDDAGLVEVEVWANIPECAECGGASDKDGKLFQCVECPRVVCAECERADRHQQHCMLRLPSRMIYDKLRTVFESISEAVTAHLPADDANPMSPELEIKTEPIEPDPLNTTITDESIQEITNDPSKSKAVAPKSLIVKVRNLPPSKTVPLPKSLPTTTSVPTAQCVLCPKTAPIQQLTYPLKRRRKQIFLKPKTVASTKSVPATETGHVTKSVLEPNSVPKPILHAPLVTEQETHVHTYTHRNVYERVTDTFPDMSELTTASTECKGTAKRKKSNSNDEVAIFTHVPETSKETSDPWRLEEMVDENFDSYEF